MALLVSMSIERENRGRRKRLQSAIHPSRRPEFGDIVSGVFPPCGTRAARFQRDRFRSISSLWRQHRECPPILNSAIGRANVSLLQKNIWDSRIRRPGPSLPNHNRRQRQEESSRMLVQVPKSLRDVFQSALDFLGAAITHSKLGFEVLPVILSSIDIALGLSTEVN